MRGPSEKATDGAASAPFSDVARERLSKLEWRCRRGMKELDFLLLRYAREHYAQAASDDREAFEAFLELPDPDLAGYLIAGHAPDDPRFAAICCALRHD